MSLFLTFILLQLNIFGGNSTAVKSAKVSLNETASGKTIAYVEIGHSGKFLFANLDPGNYNLVIEIPDQSIKKVDKRDKQKFDTNIEVAYNTDEKTYCWQRDNAYLQISINEEKKLADLIIPKFEKAFQKPIIESNIKTVTQNLITDVPHTGEENDEINSSEKVEKSGNLPETNKITILQITVIDTYGTIGGDIQSIQQKDFFKMTVGKPDMPLENLGKVQVLKRFED